MPFLKRDIYSSFSSHRLYGAAGEQVAIISDHGNVIIVQASEGLPFPVIGSDLVFREEEIAEKEDCMPPPKPQKSPVKKTRHNRAFGQDSQQQGSLF